MNEEKDVIGHLKTVKHGVGPDSGGVDQRIWRCRSTSSAQVMQRHQEKHEVAWTVDTGHLTQAIFVLLPKAVDLKDCKNYRTINYVSSSSGVRVERRTKTGFANTESSSSSLF